MLNIARHMCILLLLFGCTTPPNSSNLFVDATIQDTIPITCKSCALFLFPENDVDSYYTRGDIERIKKSFILLGDLIGKTNCAVWYHEKDDKKRISRSITMIDTINSFKTSYGKLIYKLGPTIVFMNFNPKMVTTRNGNYYTAIEFNNEKPDVIIRFMNDLTQMIREEKMGPAVLENEQLSIMCRRVMDNMHVQLKFVLLKNFIELTVDKGK